MTGSYLFIYTYISEIQIVGKEHHVIYSATSTWTIAQTTKSHLKFGAILTGISFIIFPNVVDLIRILTKILVFPKIWAVIRLAPLYLTTSKSQVTQIMVFVQIWNHSTLKTKSCNKLF